MATGRRRGRAVLFIALILILVIILLVVVAMPGILNRNKPITQVGGNPATTLAPTPEDTVDIVLTTQEIHRGQVITDDLIGLYPIPKKSFVTGLYFTDKAQLKDTRAKMDMHSQTPLTSGLIFKNGATGSVPSFEIPAGKVAISVPISKLSSVAYGLQKGDHVNVIASLLMVDMDTNFQSKLPNRTGIVIAPGPINENQTYVTALVHSPEGYEVKTGDALSYMGRIEIDPTMNNPVYVIPSESARPRLVSQTLLQDIVILQMGTFSRTVTTSEEPITAPVVQPGQPTQKATAGTSSVQRQAAAQTQTEAPIPDIITLIVSPQDAVTLNYLMLAGANLNMVLRSAGDSDISKNTESVTLQFILDQYQIPNPAKLPYGLEPRLDNFPDFIQPFPEPAIGATPTPSN
jgi:Flp pilus assembly protein CpaB